MEGTSETKILIPLIVTICVACYVGGLFNEGIYEILIEMKGYLYLEHGLGGNFNSSWSIMGESYITEYNVTSIFCGEIIL